MKKITIVLLSLLLLISILVWFFICRVSVEKRPPILLRTTSGIETTEFQLHDSIIFDAVNLLPRTGYKIQILREDGKIVTESRLSTDRFSHIHETVIWYDIGILPCLESSYRAEVIAPISKYEFSDFEYAGKSYTLSIIQGEEIVREMKFQVAKEMTRPKLYAADSRGCPKSGFPIGEEDVWVVGKNFPKGSIVRLWAVEADTEWEDFDELKDLTKQYIKDLPPIFELKGEESSFKNLLWPKGLTSIGSYDIVAEVVTYPFGSYHATSVAQVQNVVSDLSYSGFVVQRRPGVGEPIEQDAAGVRMSRLAFRDTFITSENVYVGVDPYIHPSYIGKTADVYIVADKTDAQWTVNNTLNDVTGFVESVTIQPGWCANCYSTLAWAAPLTIGKYDVVLDFNRDGVYTAGVDLIDSLDPVGFTVAEIRVDSISFNFSGSGSITIYDNINGNNITAPEFSSGADIVKPTAWIKGGSHTVRVNFKAVSTVNTAQIWAENGMGGLNSSGSPVTVTFSGGSGQGTFNVNSVPNYIDFHEVNWDWNYKNVNGSSPSTNMGITGKHIVYTVLANPQAPQSVPWLEALEIACDLAQGQTTAAGAAWEIWNDFYNNAGGVYDTVSGAPRYTGSTSTGFNLTKWLTNYNSGNIGTVNCYDMGKAVAVFANSLGCGTVYTYVSSFGYLNCVKPIGKGWANNPFYDNSYYNSNPIVPGDWDSSNGRSGFGNHGFTRLNGYIYDGSGGQVDIDSDADYGPPFNALLLAGNDTWTNNYKGKVIDNNPSYSTSTPADYSFSVY